MAYRRPVVDVLDVVEMAAGDEQVPVPVVVEVDESRSPVDVRKEIRRDRGRAGRVLEKPPAQVAVKHGHLALVVGHEQIELTVVVIVAAIDAHAGVCFAEEIVGHPGQQPRLLEISSAIVLKKEIRPPLFPRPSF